MLKNNMGDIFSPMKTKNFLRQQFKKLLSSYNKDYFTEKGWQAIFLEMLKPLLYNRKRSKLLAKVQYLAYKIFSDMRSDGENLVRKAGKYLFEDEFRRWISKHPSNRALNQLIIRVDDTKSGRKYGFKIPELQYLYDYVNKCSYSTHKVFVLMVSIGSYDFIVDFKFKKSEVNGSKIAFEMISEFINHLSKDLREIFEKEVKIALDGAYGNLVSLEDFLNYKKNNVEFGKLAFVVKSGGKQKVKLPNGLVLSLKEVERFIIENHLFKSFSLCHCFGESVSYAEQIATIIDKPYKLKLVLCRFPSRTKDFRYLLLLTNRLDWHAFRVLRTYKGRWPIETMFRTIKQKLEFEKYSFHTKFTSKNIGMHFGICFVMYMFINQFRIKHTRPKKTSLARVIETFQLELDKLSDKALLEIFLGKIDEKYG